jgi:hypothetical protein
MIEVAPDATKFSNLREDSPYLLYRTSVSGRQTEIGIFKNFICTLFAGEYSVLNDPNYDSNALYREHVLSFVPKAILRKKEINDIKASQVDVGEFSLFLRASGGGEETLCQVDTFEGLLSLTDYILALKKTETLQPKLDITQFVRLVVLKGKVISAIECLSQGEGRYSFSDFDVVLPWEAPDGVKDLACKAMSIHELDCAAVNIVIDCNGNPLVEDIVCPFNFYREEHVAGINIVEKTLNRLLSDCSDNHA